MLKSLAKEGKTDAELKVLFFACGGPSSAISAREWNRDSSCVVGGRGAGFHGSYFLTPSTEHTSGPDGCWVRDRMWGRWLRGPGVQSKGVSVHCGSPPLVPHVHSLHMQRSHRKQLLAYHCPTTAGCADKLGYTNSMRIHLARKEATF